MLVLHLNGLWQLVLLAMIDCCLHWLGRVRQVGINKANCKHELPPFKDKTGPTSHTSIWNTSNTTGVAINTEMAIGSNITLISARLIHQTQQLLFSQKTPTHPTTLPKPVVVTDKAKLPLLQAVMHWVSSHNNIDEVHVYAAIAKCFKTNLPIRSLTHQAKAGSLTILLFIAYSATSIGFESLMLCNGTQAVVPSLQQTNSFHP